MSHPTCSLTPGPLPLPTAASHKQADLYVCSDACTAAFSDDCEQDKDGNPLAIDKDYKIASTKGILLSMLRANILMMMVKPSQAQTSSKSPSTKYLPTAKTKSIPTPMKGANRV